MKLLNFPFNAHSLRPSLQVREAQAKEVLSLSRTIASKVDLLVVGGDLNSTPASKAYAKFVAEGLKDTQIELKDSEHEKFHTWGNEKNTWTSEEPGFRIDYLLYKTIGDQISNIRTSMFRVLDAKVQGMSVSDHMGVESNLRITLNK